MNLKLIFLPWLVIRELERDITKLDQALDVAEKRGDSWFKSYRIAIAQRDEARAKLAPFIAPRKRDARGHFLREVA